MKAIFSLFWQVLTFKRGPEDVVYSTKLLTLVVLANFLISAFGQSLGKLQQLNIAIVLPLLAIVIEIVVISALLQFKGLTNRFVQAATAIFGCDTLLTVATIPLLIISLGLSKGSPLLGLFGLMEVIILGWGFGLRAFIYHRTLNIGLLQANMLALAVFLLTTMITIKVFPELLVQATAAAAEASKSR